MDPSKFGASDLHQQGVQNCHYRHDSMTVTRLEEIFKECPHPDENQRRQISERLGINEQQVRFWFQNKNAQVKTMNDRLDNHALWLENGRMQSDNLILRGTLQNTPCGASGVRPKEAEERNVQFIPLLRKENIQSTDGNEASKIFYLIDSRDCDSIINFLVNSGINPMSHLDIPYCSNDASRGSFLNQTVGIPALDQHSPIPNQHIHAPASSQNIPASTPVVHLHNIAPEDCYIPDMSAVLGQNTPKLVSTHDQDNKNSVVEQEIQAPGHGIKVPSLTTLVEDIPPLGRDIPILDQNNKPPLERELDSVLEILKNDAMVSQLMMNQNKHKENGMVSQLMRSQNTHKENSFLSQIAYTAMEEMMKLLKMNAPFWLRSPHDEKLNLQHDIYQRTFHRINQLKGPNARIESSKDSREVNMSGAQLVEMFFNSDKWVDLFPTIVKKAQTVKVFESGSLGNRNGALQLMNAEIHVLSHLVKPRAFHFLRYCKQIEASAWVITDVSYDFPQDRTTGSRAWRLPSGCLILDIIQGLCRVSWLEHEEADENFQTNHLFRDVIISGEAYGARRWVLALKRMCERIECASTKLIPIYESRGAVKSVEGRKSILYLAQRMVKIFSMTLDMESNTSFPHLTRIHNNGVTISVRMNRTVPDIPRGMILSAATSFWLPLSPQSVFDYMMDNKERAKWEPLWYGNPGNEIHRIATGSNHRNCITITQPRSSNENNTMVTLRESYADALGSMTVYSAFDRDIMNYAMSGEDTSQLLVLPSGFTITWDGQSNALEGSSKQVAKVRGSVVTIMLQLLASASSETQAVDMKFVDYVTELLSSTVEKIKSALPCSN
ncbi:hypothetical protein Fmac_004878 [Flemingia macrophylla]|uniref:Uncharacterized protein n=1 Tax=Flemingia macrophylla TaxID=520843 RepID=A0ABD1N7J7_9FABA